MTTPLQTCPVCGSHNTRALFFHPTWCIRVCDHCHNGWTDPCPGKIPYDEEDFHDSVLSAKQPDQAMAHLPPEWQSSLKQQVALFQRHVKPGAAVLEVGCGEGMLMTLLQDAGYRVWGVEPSRSACKRLKTKGMTVFEGFFPQALPDDAPPFDGVIMSHVLEHIADPDAIFAHVARLAPGGHFMLIQTNWKGLIPRQRGPKWYAWVPDQHFWHFTPEGLTFIGQRHHFRAAEHEYSSLVHGRRTEKWLAHLANVHPAWKDQFHIMLKHTSNP